MRWLSDGIARKVLVGGTGIFMLLFVLLHLFGTLSSLAGPGAINSYAHALRGLGPLFWVYRVVMLSMLFIHMAFAILLTLENWKAKPERYAMKRMRVATFSGETMLWSGLLLFCFLAYHILQFVFHATPDIVASTDAEGRFDVFTMMRESLRVPFVSLVYLLSMGVLFLHLSHGIQSISQTVGILNEKTRPMFHAAGMTLSVFFLLGYGMFPVLILAGTGVFGR